MKVAIDFDNTFFTANRDVDDGMALLYLLACPEVELLAVTSTFGNKGIELVDRDTQRLLETLQLDLPYAKGGQACGDYLNPASQLLADLADQHAGDLYLLATGSLTNLMGASLVNPHFFDQLKGIALMGGTTAPLNFAKQEMLELNFSCDPQAAYQVLTKGQNVRVMTGNHCLDLLFTQDQYEAAFAQAEGPLVQLIKKYSEPWFRDNDLEYGIKGFYNWDSLAAACLVHPEYFSLDQAEYWLSVEGLSRGRLHCPSQDPTQYVATKPYQRRLITTPRISRPEELKDHLYQTWLSLDNK
ncbi:MULTISPECIES: nucleoside hydrolase [Aerococcus]|uniref:Nucleoside hydrolase n=1 Tax=Aerococcus sanguinicola TaxID=119206 RepID=A0A5N1GLV5_9LACT|nr:MULTISPECIES: nucleoside hydrolase [Aerococcus]KAA9301296.1 nucleoside hydrolase [Aerococcus sanguinicola]MDK6370067.1 nucleoside hydrolase [Aerococcus sp. UMB9870]MDK6680667.1 nucleoside hydrolase [Aerococcus sp. UMB8608]MDK6687466.1 nucleoside hydrolase [Aerococcus sp. UMB8623]MDK6940617.1 nucleoside hydrolase [Aerococcus sp. UMB8487]